MFSDKDVIYMRVIYNYDDLAKREGPCIIIIEGWFVSVK